MASIVGATTAGTWQGATTLGLPDGVQDGDLLLVWLSANAQPDVTPPAGWELVVSQVGPPLGESTGVHLYSRTANGDAGPFTFTWSGDHWHHGVLVAVRGVQQLRAHALAAEEGVDSLALPSLSGAARDLLLGFGFHWATDEGTEPTIAGMEQVAAQASVLVAAHDALAADGPTVGHLVSSTVVGRMAAVAVLLEPVPPPPIPAWEPVPESRPLPPRSEWRFYAQNLLTGVWVHRELPLSDVKITPVLSGPHRITAHIDPAYKTLRAANGQLVLGEWQTLIVAEASGQLRGGGILTDVREAGQKLDLDIVGFSGYAERQPLRSSLTWGGKTNGTSGNGVDPLDVVRRLWQYLQDQPDGNLNVTLDSTSTPYRLGEWHNARRIEPDGTLGPPKEVNSTPIPIDRVWERGERPPVAAQGKQLYWQYQQLWHDDPEVGQLITNLAGQAPFDWMESYRWLDADRTQVGMHLHFGYPRLGRRQQQLRFVEDENLSDPVTVQRDGGEYANLITVYGAGEGSKKVRATASVRDGRLRRGMSVDRPDLTTVAECQAAASEELRRWSQLTDITGFTAADHPHAPIGSFQVGDDVLVHTRTTASPVRLWVRITSMDLSPGAGEVRVTCRRSDRFDYPKG